jgi:hypothetical protein
MSKKLRFYSKEENAFIENYAKSNEPVREENLMHFCHKNKRPVNSVMFKIYDVRKKLKNQTTNKATASLVKDNKTAKMSKSEFKIPVNNWTVTNENGQMYLNIKF